MESTCNRKIIRQSKHVTRACTGCRQRKTKCDGARPQCANCRIHNQQCVMPQGVDKRTVPSKERYSRLEQYTQSLESALVSNGIALPSRLDTSALTPDSIAFNRNTAVQTPVSRDDSSWGSICSPPGEGSNSAAPVLLPDIESPVDALSDRFGSLQLADDGQVRFFGATSNLHIQHVGSFSLTDPKIRSVYGSEQGILRHAGVGNPIEEELEDHLLRLYFCWENPNIPVVDQDVFYAQRAIYRATGRPSHLYSELLANAMCAVGAALTRRQPCGLPESLAEFFSTRAKALLEVEMDAPSLCAVQALVILSGVEAFLTRDARGWLYSGMAMRLATDLGLHLKHLETVHSELSNGTEMRMRRVVFWGAYIHDRMWSFYVGRPESLDEKHIFVEPLKASDIVQDATSCWRPYIEEGHNQDSISLPGLLGDVAQYTVSLCRKMSHIRRVLYNSPSPGSTEIRSLHNAARTLRADLLSWAETLPPSLSLRDDKEQPLRPPHVLQLHMQYHAILVVIDRPFTYGRYERLPGLTAADIEECHMACTDAAVSITNILQAFRHHHGARQMNIHTVHLIFTAALVHIHNVFFAPGERTRTTACSLFRISCQVLLEIGQAYTNALRALEIITSIKSKLETTECRRSRPASDGEFNNGLNKRARLNAHTVSTPAEVPLTAPAMEGLDLLEECLDMSPSTTYLATDSLFPEGWGWISPPGSFSTGNE